VRPLLGDAAGTIEQAALAGPAPPQPGDAPVPPPQAATIALTTNPAMTRRTNDTEPSS